jgi:hypothetical protein
MRILTAVLPVLLLCAACDIKVDENGVRGVRVAEGSAEDVWTRTYTLPANGRLEVTGQNGEIDVTPASGPAIEVRAEREARANNDEAARELLRKLRIREDVTADRVAISTEGEESTWAPPGLGRRALARVRYRIKVPAAAGLTMIFRTENGGVRLTGVSGHISASTTNGGVTGEDLSGAITAQTVNGGIRLDLAAVTADITASTTNGGVRLTMPATSRANLEATCVNGGISVDDQFGLRGAEQEHNRRLTAAVNGGGPRVSATSVNGGIRIRARGSSAD